MATTITAFVRRTAGIDRTAAVNGRTDSIPRHVDVASVSRRRVCRRRMRVDVEIRFVEVDVARLHPDADCLAWRNVGERRDIEVVRPTTHGTRVHRAPDVLEHGGREAEPVRELAERRRIAHIEGSAVVDVAMWNLVVTREGKPVLIGAERSEVRSQPCGGGVDIIRVGDP